MNLEEHLLVTLMEEAAELQKVAAKALRFGLDDTWRDAEYTDSPRNLIQHELSDLIAVAEMLAQKGVLSWPIANGTAVEQKKLKVIKFFNYAREQGTLKEEVESVL